MKLDIAFLVRLAVVGAILGYVFNDGGGGTSPSGPYTGPMAAVHSAAQSMEKNDRAANMSQAFTAGHDMVSADKRNLLDNTQEAADYLTGLLTFDYNGIQPPSKKYPALADAIEAEFQKAVGTDIKAMDSAEKQKYIDFLGETGRAIQ
jgi:hypothetical protein